MIKKNVLLKVGKNVKDRWQEYADKEFPSKHSGKGVLSKMIKTWINYCSENEVPNPLRKKEVFQTESAETKEEEIKKLRSLNSSLRKKMNGLREEKNRLESRITKMKSETAMVSDVRKSLELEKKVLKFLEEHEGEKFAIYEIIEKADIEKEEYEITDEIEEDGETLERVVRSAEELIMSILMYNLTQGKVEHKSKKWWWND